MSTSIFASGSSKIRSALPQINNLDDTVFRKLLQRIAEKAGRQNETIFTPDELNKMESSFNLTIEQIKALIETLEYMFLQSAYHLIKPAALENDLINEHNFEESKAKLFVEQWSNQAKEIVERLKSSHIASHSLADVRWTLDIGISQASKSKVKRPMATYEFQLKNHQSQELEKLQLEFNKDELYAFFEKLESIQSQLDTLMT